MPCGFFEIPAGIFIVFIVFALFLRGIFSFMFKKVREKRDLIVYVSKANIKYDEVKKIISFTFTFNLCIECICSGGESRELEFKS